MSEPTQEFIAATDQPIAAYSEFRAALAQLKADNDAAVFNYADPVGNKEARSHVYKLKRTKTAVDAARKAEKDASLQYGRRVDSEAKEIMGQIDEMIAVHERPLKEIEEAEATRKQDILNRMGRIVAFGEVEKTLSSTALGLLLQDLESIVVDESFDESMAAASKLKKESVAYLETAIAAAEQREAEAAELARLRVENEARERAAREAAIAADAAAKAKADAEAAAERGRLAAEAAAKREQDAAVAREQAERARADKAVADAKAAEERAARAATEAVERERRKAEARAQAERDAAARREANREHRASINNAALMALYEHAGLELDQARQVVEAIAKRLIPAVTINY